jgi:Ca-activated chloride channel homolog
MALDYYAILGVPYNASSEEIRNAYFQLARHYHPDTNPDHKAENREKFIAIQQAYETLSTPQKKNLYDSSLSSEKKSGAEVSINVKYSRSVLPPMKEPQLAYVLVDMFCMAELNPDRLPPFHICLVLDRSTSMQGDRMDMVKASALNLIQQLRPQDILSVVSFSDRADLVIPPTRSSGLSRSDSRINLLHTGGGTEIFQGLSLGVEQLRNTNISYSRQLILLTDGNTYGDDQKCLELAQEAAHDGISVSVLGIGHEWNDSLMDQLAGFGGGNASLVSSSRDLDQFIQFKLKDLESVYARNLKFDFESTSGVQLRYVFRLSPNIGPLSVSNSLLLGDIHYHKSMSLLLEFLVPPTMDIDRVTLARGLIQMEMPGKTNVQVRLVVDFFRNVEAIVPDETPPAVLMEALSRLTLYRMQDRVRSEVKAGQIEKATKTLQYLATQLLSQGDRELAHTVLIEAEHVKQSHQFSKEGDKRIKYGTRALMLPANLE